MADVEVTIIDNEDEQRYDALVDGELAGSAMYRDDGGRRVFTHTQVGSDYEGEGVGSALARGALEDVRRRGMRIVARCPFIASYIERHAEFADLTSG